MTITITITVNAIFPVTEIVISDSEWDQYILNDEEQRKRTNIWEANFRVYRDEREQRRKDREEYNKSRGEDGRGVKRKKYTRQVTDHSTASRAVLGGNAIAKAASSSKINYEALQGVFQADGNFAVPVQKNTHGEGGVGGENAPEGNNDDDINAVRNLAAPVRAKIRTITTGPLGAAKVQTSAAMSMWTAIQAKAQAPVEVDGGAGGGEQGVAKGKVVPADEGVEEVDDDEDEYYPAAGEDDYEDEDYY